MKPPKNPHAVALGHKGGKARASKLTPARLLEISRKANAAKAAKKGQTQSTKDYFARFGLSGAVLTKK